MSSGMRSQLRAGYDALHCGRQQEKYLMWRNASTKKWEWLWGYTTCSKHHISMLFLKCCEMKFKQAECTKSCQLTFTLQARDPVLYNCYPSLSHLGWYSLMELYFLFKQVVNCANRGEITPPVFNHNPLLSPSSSPLFHGE